MAHELATYVNWPDLYDIDNSGEGVGEWSLMGSGSWGESTTAGHLPGDSPTHPDAFSLYYQGWITPTVATVADNIPVHRRPGGAARPPNPGGTRTGSFNETEGDGEYFLLENRTQEGYYQSTPGCGIVIYRIDETVTPSNFANSDEDDPLIAVMQADGLENLESGDNRATRVTPGPAPRQQARLQQRDDAQHQVPRQPTASNLAAARGLDNCLCREHDARGRDPPR